MILHQYPKILIFIIIALIISNTVPSTIIKQPEQISYQNNNQNTHPDICYYPQTHILLSKNNPPTSNSGNGPGTIDQYQTYGNCWIGTNEHILILAQSFTPTYHYLDFIDLKLWINFTTPIIDIIFTIHTSQNNQPHIQIPGGISSTYQSNDFYYSSTIPNPNNHITCPWTTITFPNQPALNPGELYWLQIKITTILQQNKHVWIAGALNTTDLYHNGTFAYYKDTWQNIPTLDLMFITYGYNDEYHPPTADTGGPYYGYENGGETITFDASKSHDNDENGNTIILYEWKFTEYDTWHQTTSHQIQHTYTQPGTQTITLKITDNEGDTAAAMSTVIIYPAGPPHIAHIHTFFADGSTTSYNQGFLLQGLDITNIYTATATGKNIDQVEFTFDGLTYYDDNGDNGWTFAINTKNIINPLTTLTLRAHNHNGWGNTYTHTPRIIPLAGWLYQYLTYLLNSTNTSFVTLETGIRDTPPLLENNYWTLIASINLSIGSPQNPDEPPVTAGVNVPVEDVGGEYQFQGGIGSSISIISDGTIDINGQFLATISAKAVTGNIAASLHGVIKINNQIQWQYMYLTINGDVTIPIFYIPLEICGIGIESGIDITPHVEVAFNLEPTTHPNQGIIPGLGIKIKDENGIIGNVGAQIRAYAEAGIGIGNIYTEAGGDGILYFQTPSPPGYLKNFILNCWIGGHIELLGWTHEGWWEYQWQYQTNKPTLKTYNATPWQPINRNYLNPQHGSYYEFQNTTTNTGTILTNIYPYSKPTIHHFPNSTGTKHLLAWTYDNPALPQIEGLGIHYSIWEKNQGFTTPQSLSTTANDSQLQINPQLTFDNLGNGLCIYLQTPPTINSTSPLLDILQNTELAYSKYNPKIDNWSPPTYITTNNHLDIHPTLATNHQGDIILLWISDTDNNLQTIHDRNLHLSTWNGTTWTPPQILASNLPITSTPKIAHHTNTRGQWEAYCTFTLDEDLNPTTPKDQNIYYLEIKDQPSNTTLKQLTNTTTQQHTSPTIIYGYDNQPYCIWLTPTINTTNQPPTQTSTMYYQSLNTTRNTPKKLFTGNIISPQPLQNNGNQKDKSVNFVIGWIQTDTNPTIHCAIIHQNQTIQHGILYGSTHHLSQTTWNFQPGGITTCTIERPSLKSTDKQCNLTFIHTNGFDTTPPETTIHLKGNHLSNGPYGPIYHTNLTIHLNAQDIGLAGLKTIYYTLDNTAWHPYNNTPIIITNPKAHIFRYYAIDRAGNQEPTHIQQFMIVTTQPPSQPLQPCGPTHIQKNTEHIYYTTSIDPDTDQLYYKWNWGDEISPWYGPYKPGELCVISHTWTTKGIYTIQVISRDTYNRNSPWSDPLEISVPIIKNIIHPFLQKTYKQSTMFTKIR